MSEATHIPTTMPPLPADAALLALGAQWRAAQAEHDAACAAAMDAEGTPRHADAEAASEALWRQVEGILHQMADTPAGSALGLAAKSFPVMVSRQAHGGLSAAEARLAASVWRDNERLLLPAMAGTDQAALPACPVAALLPELAEAQVAEDRRQDGAASSRRVAELEEAASLAPAATHGGALLHIAIARADILSVLDTEPGAATDTAMLERAERCLWSAFHALGGGGGQLPGELGSYYGDAAVNPFTRH